MRPSRGKSRSKPAVTRALRVPKQARGAETRERLLAAARELFGLHGYEGTSIEVITTRAGVAVGAFYTYFPSKRQVLLVLMNTVLERFQETDLRPAARGTLHGALRDRIGEIFRNDVEVFQTVRAWQEAGVRDPEIAGKQAEITSWTETRVLRLFQRLRKHPKARTERDPAVFARMVNHHMWALLARAATMSQGEFDREMRVTADAVYHYLFRDDA